MPRKQKKGTPPAPKPTWQPPLYSNADIQKHQNQIDFMKQHSDIVECLEIHADERKYNEKDIDKFVFWALSNSFSKKKNRCAMPTTYFTFKSYNEEIEMNHLMKDKLVSYRENRRKYKDIAPKEVAIDMQINNNTYDWGLFGAFKAYRKQNRRLMDGKTDLPAEEFREYITDMVNKYVESRNQAFQYAKEIEEKNHCKFIAAEDVYFEFLFHMSNFFDIMFGILEKVNEQHNEVCYVQFFENFFDVTPANDLRFRNEFLEVRTKVEMNDGWILVNDEIELNQRRFLWFLNNSNVKQVVDKYMIPQKLRGDVADTNREKYYRLACDQWLNNSFENNFVHIRIRRELTFDHFYIHSNYQETHKEPLFEDEDNIETNEPLMEILAREFYNTYIVGVGKLPNWLQFDDGTTVDDYYIPKQKVLVYTDKLRELLPPEEPVYGRPCPLSKKNLPENQQPPAPASKKFESVDKQMIATRSLRVVSEPIPGPSGEPPMTDHERNTSKTIVPVHLSTPGHIIGGEPFVRDPESLPNNCDKETVEAISNWQQKCVYVSASECSDEVVLPDSDPRDYTSFFDKHCAEQVKPSTQEMADMVVSQDGVDEEMPQQQVIPALVVTEPQNVPCNASQVSQEIQFTPPLPPPPSNVQTIPHMVSVHPDGISLIPTSLKMENQRDPVFAVQGSNELTHQESGRNTQTKVSSGSMNDLSLTLEQKKLLFGTEIETIQEVEIDMVETPAQNTEAAPDRVVNMSLEPGAYVETPAQNTEARPDFSEDMEPGEYDEIINGDTQPLPDEYLSSIGPPVLTSTRVEPSDAIIPTENIKKEHDTVYSPYDDSVNAYTMVSDPIVIEDDENDFIEHILGEYQSRNPKQLEEGGTQNMEIETLAVPSTSIASEQQSIVANVGPLSRSMPLRNIAPCTQLRNWDGNAVQTSEVNIEDFSDEDDNPSGKDLINQSPNVLSQNNSLLASTQVTNLLHQNQPAQNQPLQQPAQNPTTTLIRTFVPSFKFISFNFKRATETSPEYLKAVIRIPVVTGPQFLEITTSENLRRLLNIPSDVLINDILYLLRHFPSYSYETGKNSNNENPILVVLDTLFHQHRQTNVTLEYENNENSRQVVANCVVNT